MNISKEHHTIKILGIDGYKDNYICELWCDDRYIKLIYLSREQILYLEKHGFKFF